jgi:hypothetical protein
VRRAAGILVLTLVLAFPVGAGAVITGKQKTTHTTGGTAAAARAVLAVGDLGAGWAAGKPGAQDQDVSCGSAPPNGVVETGKAVSPTFHQSSAGPFVSQVVFVYATAAQAKQVWQQAAGKAALSCLSQSVSSGSTKDIRFTVLHRQTLAPPAAGKRSAAYRVVASAHTTAQTIPAYIDLVLVNQGNAVTEIFYSGFSEPLGRSFEARTARAVARRL